MLNVALRRRSVGGGGCSQQVYEVSLADYGNAINTCDGIGDSWYNDCGASFPTFTWTDTEACTPSSVTVSYTKGISCNGGTFPVLLNGASVTTWSQTGTQCFCTPVKTPDSTVITDLASYNDGGSNTVTFEGSSCFGFSLIAGTNLYAIVTVDY